MVKKLVIVDCISQFLNRYVVEVEDDIDHALDEVIMEESNPNFKEFSQEYLGSTPIQNREISKEEYLKEFNKSNAYLSSWTDDMKFDLINKIDYGK